MAEIFMDSNSTTRPYDSVVKKMAKIQEKYYGNPSTSYKIGKSAKEIIEDSRTTICRLLGIKNPDHLVLNSGASESNNNIIRGFLDNCKNKSKTPPKVLCSAIEHASIYDTCEALHNQKKCKLEIIPVDSSGFIIEEALFKMTDKNTKLVCIMISNNEIGTIQNIPRLVKIVKSKNKDAFFLCDCTQYVGKYRLNVCDLGVDAITFSAHKFHASRGVGAMYLKNPNSILPCNTGGHQEHNLRAGTENTAGIAGMAMALEICMKNLDKIVEKVTKLRNYMENSLLENIPNSKINCPSQDIRKRLYNTISITFPHKINNMLKKLNDAKVYANTGSACSANRKSRVLSTIGLKNNEVSQTLRISLSSFNTKKECDSAIKKIIEIVNDC